MEAEENIITLGEFLSEKRDYSPFLVHLTKDDLDNYGNLKATAHDALYSILSQKELRAQNHFCYFSPALNDKSEIPSIKDNFRVVCFTETPIDQINVLLRKVIGKRFEPEPYGLIFHKDYIKDRGGNPVFYVTKRIAKPLMDIIYKDYVTENQNVHEGICSLLALITVCEEGNDFHWEREWRIVGNLDFTYSDIYCGICPESEIKYFENEFQLIFIDPHWGIYEILDKMIKKSLPPSIDLPY